MNKLKRFVNNIKIVCMLLKRLHHAESEHPASEWNSKDVQWAIDAATEEMKEVQKANLYETRERVNDECLDVIAVCFRIIRNDMKQE